MDLSKKFDKLLNDYESAKDESVRLLMMHDSITNQKYSLVDVMIDLRERVEHLEDRCKSLEEENRYLTKQMYEIANSLDQRIDILRPQ